VGSSTGGAVASSRDDNSAVGSSSMGGAAASRGDNGVVGGSRVRTEALDRATISIRFAAEEGHVAGLPVGSQ